MLLTRLVCYGAIPVSPAAVSNLITYEKFIQLLYTRKRNGKGQRVNFFFTVCWEVAGKVTFAERVTPREERP